MRTYLTLPSQQWQIEETDILLSILPAGSFTRLQVGTEGIYKGTQKVIILGFAEDLKVEQTLADINSENLPKFTQTINCIDPSKQQVLVLY